MQVVPNIEGLLPMERHSDEEQKRWLAQELYQFVSILKDRRRKECVE
jgi:hypothetical protein